MKAVNSSYILDRLETEGLRRNEISVEKAKQIVEDAPLITGASWHHLSADHQPPEDQALLVSFANISYPLTGYYEDGVFYMLRVGVKNIAFRDLGYVVNGWCLAPLNL